MSLLDKLKDVLTTDEAEIAAKAKEIADQAQNEVEEAEKKAAELQRQADEAAHKAGLPTEADKAAEEAKAKAEAAAAEARKQAAEVAARAKQVQEVHNEHVQATAKKAELRTYKVVRGDTLSEIGAKFDVSWKKIAELNHIKNPNLIYPGQVFKIPAN